MPVSPQVRHEQKCNAARTFRAKYPERVRAINLKYDCAHREERAEYQRRYREANREKLQAKSRLRRETRLALTMLKHAKHTATRKNIPFDLCESDIDVPPFCPVLGLQLQVGKGRRTDASPSLDRVVPSLGYVRGNVRVISWRANNLKSDATAAELRAVLQYMESEFNGY